MEELNLQELADLLNQRRISSRELCSEYLSRIASLNHRGPVLNAVIETEPETERIALALDEERKQGIVRSVLHGIPVLLKDNIETAGTMLTSAGSLALAGAPSFRESFIAGKLRAAGAVILGKANLSEWANFRSTHSSSGWSSRGGQCCNPYDLTRSPCGSSSGSAVAVASGMVPAAVGTETDGSIICPSAMNSLTGIKPTIGLVSRSGIVPIAPSQDTAGPMAKSAADAGILLEILAGYDKNDPGTADAPADSGRKPADSLSGLRIGIVRNCCGFDARVDEIFEQHIKLFEKAGAEIVDECTMPNSGEWDEAELTVLLYEFKDSLNRYLNSRTGIEIASLAQLINYNETHAETMMPCFGQELLIKAQEKGPLSDTAYHEAKKLCRELTVETGLIPLFEDKSLAMLASPSNGPAWKIDQVNGDRYTGGSSSIAAVSGYPSLTFPAGYISGLPIGTTLMGKPFSEQLLVETASHMEKQFPVRRGPELP